MSLTREQTEYIENAWEMLEDNLTDGNFDLALGIEEDVRDRGITSEADLMKRRIREAQREDEIEISGL